MSNTARASAALISLAVLTLPVLFVLAQTDAVSDIQRQINEHNAQIEALDKEIAQYQVQLDAVSSKKKTLQNTLTQLNLLLKKSAASISSTKKKIESTQLEIQELSRGIADKQESIDTGRAGISQSLRQLREFEGVPLVVQILSNDDISEIWSDIDANQSLQSAIDSQIERLATQKKSLTDVKEKTEAKRVQLLKQQNTLLSQQGTLNAQKKAQNELLAQTKSQESTYQAIISQKKSQEASLEAALSDLKAKYNVAVNPSEVTAAGKGILKWPLDKVRITQYFGNTAFAKKGAYSGSGHNGIDLAAQIGTPVKAALSGTVIGTSNTDAVRGCYSFGKWVMVKHNNGLSTMYAHLSQVVVSQGQSVGTGSVIAYSGETGYATGPHLHFGVYVSAATHIIKLIEATNKVSPCAQATLPIVPLSGYLNPLNYL